MSEVTPETIARLLQGETELVVSHPGRSQYSAPGSGASACGLAALNCARLVLQAERDGVRGTGLLEHILKQEFSEVCSEGIACPSTLLFDDFERDSPQEEFKSASNSKGVSLEGLSACLSKGAVEFRRENVFG